MMLRNAVQLRYDCAPMRYAASKRTYSTPEAAKKIGVSLRTFKRWIASGKIRASQSMPFGSSGRMLWRWTEADIRAAFKVKATQRRGRSSRKKDIST